MWFCPVRTEETSAQYTAARKLLGHDMTTIGDLTNYLASFWGGTFIILNHNLWVQRRPSAAFMIGILPDPAKTVANSDPAIYGWPKKSSDRASAHVPFLSETCFSGYGTPGGGNPDNINVTGANNLPSIIAAKKTSGHVYGKSLPSISVNLVLVDGHVESHKKQFIKWVYTGDSAYNAGFFY
jgi:hypothetical protein